MVNNTKPKHDEKSWREDKVDHVGLGKRQSLLFKDTSPNYSIISNPCESPLYVSTSPLVSDKVADLVIPPFGRQIYAQMHGMRELHLMCYDGIEHSVIVKSWEGEFSPSAIPQSQQFSVANEDVSLGTVTVGNLPNVQTVAVNNLPAIQDVNVTNTLEIGQPLPAGTNAIGTVQLGNGSVNVDIGRVALGDKAGNTMTIGQYGTNDGWGALDKSVPVGSFQGAFNGATWDRWRNNTEGTLLSSSARTVGTGSTIQTNYNARGVIITIDVTAVSGTSSINPSFCGVDHLGQMYVMNTSFAGITATGKYVYILYPATSSTGGAVKGVVNSILPKKWYVFMNHLDASSVTYSVGYSLIL